MYISVLGTSVGVLEDNFEVLGLEACVLDSITVGYMRQHIVCMGEHCGVRCALLLSY